MAQLRNEIRATAQDTFDKSQEQVKILGKKIDDIDKIAKNAEEQIKKYSGIGKKMEEVEKAVKELEKEIKKNSDEGHGGTKSRFNGREAKDVRPGTWDDKVMFSDLQVEVRIWARTLHDDFVDLL